MSGQEELWDRLYASSPRAWRGNSRVPHPNSGRALDLGCGNGKTVSSLIDLGYDVTGLDFSARAVEACGSLFGGRARFVKGDVTSLPFDDGSFDYVTAVHVLEHLDDDMLAMCVSEVRRVLRPGGHVFVRSFTPEDMRSVGRADGEIFYRYYMPDDLVRAFGGFGTVSAERVDERTRFGTVRSRAECLFRLER